MAAGDGGVGFSFSGRSASSMGDAVRSGVTGGNINTNVGGLGLDRLTTEQAIIYGVVAMFGLYVLMRIKGRR